MSLSHEICVPVTLGDGTTPFELLLYAPTSDGVSLESIMIVPENPAALEAVNYTELLILNKGVDGTDSGNDIADITTEDIAAGFELVANVKQEIALSISVPYELNYALTIEKTDVGTAVDLGLCMVILKVREK